ncbi:MAG TPA: alpha/beta hydrolase [Nocardioidaceae bacterium]|jgi:pimeloyl-ACP methyl ester carboxylesterase|nr:alpha/beta hydrolase [Nocardioidaceae bacterium]
MARVQLAHGPVEYVDHGPADGPPVVFVHGVLVNGVLWHDAARLLGEHGVRAIAPDWPIGAHRLPFGPDADLSPRGIAGLVAEFCERLGLEDVTLVGNDSGGVVCQYVAALHPQRVGRLVLTNCDGPGAFPPRAFKAFIVAGRRRATLLPVLRLSGTRTGARLLMAALTRKPHTELARSWMRASAAPGVVDDVVRFMRGVDERDYQPVAAALRSFDRPVLLVWGAGDRWAFTPAVGRRIARLFHDARIVEVPHARAFVSLDAPAILCKEVAAFIATSRQQPAA